MTTKYHSLQEYFKGRYPEEFDDSQKLCNQYHNEEWFNFTGELYKLFNGLKYLKNIQGKSYQSLVEIEHLNKIDIGYCGGYNMNVKKENQSQLQQEVDEEIWEKRWDIFLPPEGIHIIFRRSSMINGEEVNWDDRLPQPGTKDTGIYSYKFPKMTPEIFLKDVKMILKTYKYKSIEEVYK